MSPAEQPPGGKPAFNWQKNMCTCWIKCSWLPSSQGELWAAPGNDKEKGRKANGCYWWTQGNRVMSFGGCLQPAVESETAGNTRPKQRKADPSRRWSCKEQCFGERHYGWQPSRRLEIPGTNNTSCLSLAQSINNDPWHNEEKEKGKSIHLRDVNTHSWGNSAKEEGWRH